MCNGRVNSRILYVIHQLNIVEHKHRVQKYNVHHANMKFYSLMKKKKRKKRSKWNELKPSECVVEAILLFYIVEIFPLY